MHQLIQHPFRVASCVGPTQHTGAAKSATPLPECSYILQALISSELTRFRDDHQQESGADVQGRRHQPRRYAGICARAALRRMLTPGTWCTD
eukprot:747214-Hanusia_phi.AAC.1